MKIFLRPTQNYLAIQTEDQIANSDRKIGYISTNVDSYCWLNVQDELKEKLSKETVSWIPGNSNGGSAEDFKARFDSIEDCKNLLRKHFTVLTLK